MVAASTLTVLGQFTTKNNCKGIHYTENQDKRCLECLITSPKKDSLISNYSLQIVNFKMMIISFDEKNELILKVYNEEKKVSEQLRKDLKKAKRWNRKLLISGPLIGILAGILLIK
jgi:hypothetical protein